MKGNIELYIFEFSPKNFLYDKEGAKKCIKVPCMRLDDYFKNVNEEISLIKMDVQGAEFDVMKGATNLLKQLRAIIFEFWPYGLKLANSEPKEMLRFLENNNFKLFNIDIQNKNIERIDIEEFIRKIPNNKEYYTNILVLKNRK
ncbi:MAG TPA: FkbM family methyltransferase [Geobacterales bacterium]|nr:FkbM family methyltransferase [Geobacterales bacterium]